MGVSGGPYITRDSSLVLELDAADQNSYPGSGTVWTDLSTSNSQGILTGSSSPTYTSTFNGGITFNGTNQYVSSSLSNISIPGTISVCCWVRHSTVPSAVQRYVTVGANETAVIRHDGSIYAPGTFLFYILTSGTLKFLPVAGQITTNTNYYFCGTWDGTTMRAYKNGAQIGTSTPGGTMATSNLPYYVTGATPECLNGSIFCTQIYNRALSATEITQNYNAQKSRFGLI
jgi:hypothetical protein